MNIHQFNLQFNAEEDRIIFRLNTTNKEEFRFFFTRRFVKLLWPVLLQLLGNDLMKREPARAHAAKAVLGFEHEKVVSQANFKKKYAAEEAKRFPLGEGIVLLSKIQVKQGPHGAILCLHPSKGKGLEFPVSNSFLHPFCKLLADSVDKAEWEIRLVIPGNEPVGNAKPANRVLH